MVHIRQVVAPPASSDAAPSVLRTKRGLDSLDVGIEPPAEALPVSGEAWSLYLARFRLLRSFDAGIFRKNPKNSVFFTGVAWDRAGAAEVCPEGILKGQPIIHNAYVDEDLWFHGSGLPLWASRPVTQRLDIVFYAFDSDEDLRKGGATAQKIVKAIQGSKLVSLVTAAGVATGVPGATAAVVSEAALELAGILADLAAVNEDDRITVFQTSFGTEESHRTQIIPHRDRSAEMDFRFLATKRP